MHLSVSGNGSAYWTVGCTNNIDIELCKLIEMLEYLIDNIFIMVGNRVFKQHVGIPMGTNCAPLLANLYLFYYEYNYMKGLIKSDFLQALNNPGFPDEIANIYPPELIIKKDI